MLEMKLTKGRTISSDGKMNFILMNGDKAIGYYIGEVLVSDIVTIR